MKMVCVYCGNTYEPENYLLRYSCGNPMPIYKCPRDGSYCEPVDWSGGGNGTEELEAEIAGLKADIITLQSQLDKCKSDHNASVDEVNQLKATLSAKEEELSTALDDLAICQAGGSGE